MSVRRYTAYNVGGAVLPIAISLLTVPAYLHQVGEARFGILSIVWLLLGYFGLFDLGLGLATAQQIAARGPDGSATQARIFWTALLTNGGVGVVGGLIALPVGYYYFGSVMKVAPDFRAEMLATIPWLVFAVPVATVTGVLTGALQGLNRFATLNIISMSGTMFFQLLPLAAAYLWSPSLTVVLPMALAARAVTVLLLAADCRRALLRGYPVSFDRSELRNLVRFGLWTTIPLLFVPLLSMLDRIAIGAYLGATAVTLYAVPFNLGQRLCVFGDSLASASFPRFSVLGTAEGIRLGSRLERTLSALMLVVIVTAVFLVEPLLSVWINPAFASRSALVAEILLVGTWFEAVSRIPLYGLRGQFRPKTVAVIEVAQVVPFWVALYLLIIHYGIPGAAVAYVLRCGMNYLLLSGQFGTLARTWKSSAASFFLMAFTVGVVALVEPRSGIWFAALVTSVAVSGSFAWAFLPAEEYQELLSRIRRLAVSARRL